MTLEEKQNLQRKVIDELYISLNESPSNLKKYQYGYLLPRLKKLLKIEMKYYGITCGMKDTFKNGIELIFINAGRDADFAAYFTNNVAFYDDRFARLYIPQIKMNVDVSAYYDLSNREKKARLNACKRIVKDLFHEIRHFRQTLMIQSGYSSYINLRNAREKAFILVNRRIYNLNHNIYSIEADAEYSSHIKVDKLRSLTSDETFAKNKYKLNRNIGLLVVPAKGLVDRDEYVSQFVEEFLAKSKKGGFLQFFPCLGKEYTNNCRPRRLYDLIKYYEMELFDAETRINDPEQQKEVIQDIKEMYFELFKKRLLKNNNYELSEAIRLCGLEEVKNILCELKLYNQRDKKKKNTILSKKLNLYKDYDKFGNFLLENAGYIVDIRNKNKKMIKPERYIDRIDIKTENADIIDFIYSDWFLDNLPELGYYLLKSGEKISIEDFINNYAIPELEYCHNEARFKSAFIDAAKENLKPMAEAYTLYQYEQVNRSYQLFDNRLNECLNSKFIKDKHYNYDITGKYGLDLLETMDLIIRACNGEDDLIDYYRITFYDPHLNYIESSLSVEEIQVLHNELLRVAKLLDRDEVFNPTGIHYYKKLLQKNTKIIKSIKAFLKDYNETAFEEKKLKREQ